MPVGSRFLSPRESVWGLMSTWGSFCTTPTKNPQSNVTPRRKRG